MLDQRIGELFEDRQAVCSEEGAGAERMEDASGMSTSQANLMVFQMMLIHASQLFTIVSVAIVAICVLFLSTNARSSR